MASPEDEARRRERPHAAAPPPAAADPGELLRTCPICGKALAERKCKLYCPDPVCGYYLSCADYY